MNYKAINKGSLLGFADIYVPKMGLEIFGCAVFQKGNHKWIAFPSKEIQSNSGEKKYFNHLRFREKSHMDAFSNAAIEAIMKKANTVAAPSHTEQNEEIPF